jgi:hypothetical protein
VGDLVTFTAGASAAAPSSAVPTGAFTFYVNGVQQASTTANTLTIAFQAAGSDTVTVVFTPSADPAGNVDFTASFASLVQVVVKGGGRQT